MNTLSTVISEDVIICFTDKRIRLLVSFSFSDLKKLIKTLSAAYGWEEDDVIVDIPPFFGRV
ncbi:MAG: hypothetical protein LCH81_03705 [Bacteroidetes bacterium]|nr:hypothetical protein [Bacteroidota bacterium]